MRTRWSQGPLVGFLARAAGNMVLLQQFLGSGCAPGMASRETDSEDVMSALNISHLVQHSINIETLDKVTPQSRGSPFGVTCCQLIWLETSLCGLHWGNRCQVRSCLCITYIAGWASYRLEICGLQTHWNWKESKKSVEKNQNGIPDELYLGLYRIYYITSMVCSNRLELFQPWLTRECSSFNYTIVASWQKRRRISDFLGIISSHQSFLRNSVSDGSLPTSWKFQKINIHLQFHTQ